MESARRASRPDKYKTEIKSINFVCESPQCQLLSYEIDDLCVNFKKIVLIKKVPFAQFLMNEPKKFILCEWKIKYSTTFKSCVFVLDLIH